MKLVKWCVAGLIGGAISAGVWAAIAYFSGMEIGWIAWFVGVIVGFCVRAAAGEDEGFAPGVTAVVIAILALLAGKYAAVSLIVDREFAKEIASFAQVTPEDMQNGLCAEVVQEWTAANKPMQWPPGQSLDTAEQMIHYPQSVQDEARKRWTDLDPAEQQKQLTERQELLKELTGAIGAMAKQEGFKASFNGFDILFFILAIVSAFKVGSGAQSND
ncbi:MAG: hypothetical protein DWH91_06575 [Planctomycetota bacterium]|nr:MAG: hypothetical protein DWH91_06575 [Planctomycetota bacterium]